MIEFRPLVSSEIREAVILWEGCGLTRPWNDPVADAQRAIQGPHSTIFCTLAAGGVIGAAMTGWDDHRGWISHLGVDADFRRWGIGRKLVQACEDWLAEHNVLETQVTVPGESGHAAKFFEATGYEEDTNRVFRKRLRSRAW